MQNRLNGFNNTHARENPHHKETPITCQSIEPAIELKHIDFRNIGMMNFVRRQLLNRLIDQMIAMSAAIKFAANTSL